MLRKGGNDSIELSEAIAKFSRTRAYHRVMFVSSEQEMADIYQIIGKIEPEPEHFNSPPMVVWQAPMAATESSPNFFFAGKLN